jgi:hypothetical protein
MKTRSRYQHNAFTLFEPLHPKHEQLLELYWASKLRSELQKANLVISLSFGIRISLSAIMAWIIVARILAYGRVLRALLGHVVHLLLGVRL